MVMRNEQLQPTDWSARWITQSQKKAMMLPGSQWIWHGPPDSLTLYRPGEPIFHRSMELPKDVSVASASVMMACADRFELFVNDLLILRGADSGAMLQVEAGTFFRPGENQLKVLAGNSGRRSSAAGLIGCLTVTLRDGRIYHMVTDSSWQSSTMPTHKANADSSQETVWQNAHVLGPYGIKPWQNLTLIPTSLPIFRKEFFLQRKIQQALVHVCGLGQYELWLNGKRVGEQVMAPVWSHYAKTCYYDTYEVTSLLRPGANVAAVWLGNGMYNVAGGRYLKFRGSYGPPKLILQLEGEYVDGESFTLISDDSWKTAAGPITFSCIFGGEDFDARREPSGWDQSGFDQSEWLSAENTNSPGGVLTACPMPGIAVQTVFRAKQIKEPKPGVFVYDLGQNFSGWPVLSVRGKAGAIVRLIPGEWLDGNGLVTQKQSGEPVWFSYTLKGEGEEKWHPRFSYYGFRYVQVEGAVPSQLAVKQDPRPHVLELSGEFLYNRSPVSGRFSCSDTLINAIHGLILAAIRSNFQSVLTDCPHREKLGWLEVSHLLARGVMYNYQVPRFYAKISQDMAESQLADGLVPDIAPEFTVFEQGFRDSPEWGSAVVFNPWHVYQMYGDDQLLRRYYPVMKKYVNYLGNKAKGQILSHGLGDWYDIGPAAPGSSQLTSTGLTATAIYYGDLQILAETARRLLLPEEAQQYADQADSVRAAFNKRFFKVDSGYYDRGSQTAQAMPLVLGLVPPERREQVLNYLVDRIRENNNRVTAGDVGFMFLIKCLTEANRHDVVYELVCQQDGPGYAEQLRKGATSLTEAWDANPSSSQNHCMLGHAEEWFYAGLAGIRPDPDHPGFKNTIIKPAFLRQVNQAQAEFVTPYGRVRSAWERKQTEVLFQLLIPANSSATVYLPATLADVWESNRPCAEAPGVLNAQTGTRRCVLNLGSGNYFFRFRPADESGSSMKP